MSDLKRFIDESSQQHPAEFANFDKEYETFKLGVLLKQARSEAGLTQDEVAKRLKIRVDSSLHGKVAVAAIHAGKSLNKWVIDTLEQVEWLKAYL